MASKVTCPSLSPQMLDLDETAPAPLTCTPAHPRPQAGEAFTSLALRAARANGLKPRTYAAVLLGHKPFWLRDPDRTVDDGVLAAFAQANLMTVAAVRASTLPALAGRLFAEHNPAGNTRWLLPLGVYGASRNRAGSLYCPQCLATAPAYFRLAWRLGFMTGCPVHGARLREACPECGAPVAYHRRDLNARLKVRVNDEPITLCWRCAHDLVNVAPLDAPHPAAARLQAQLDQGVATGAVEWDGRQVPALEFSDVAYQLTKIIGVGRRAARLRDLAVVRSGELWPPAPRRLRLLELMSLDERHAALALTGTLMTGLDDVLDACAEVGLSASRVLRDMPHCPAWFGDAVWTRLGRKHEFPNFTGRWERGKTRAPRAPRPTGGLTP